MKNFLLVITLIIAFFIINNMGHSIYTLWQKHDLVTKTENELDKEKSQHAKLERQLRTVQDPQFVEEEARNKLFLVKPNEQVIVLPSETVSTTPSPTPTPDIIQPNWQQWKELFFPEK